MQCLSGPVSPCTSIRCHFFSCSHSVMFDTSILWYFAAVLTCISLVTLNIFSLASLPLYIFFSKISVYIFSPFQILMLALYMVWWFSFQFRHVCYYVKIWLLCVCWSCVLWTWIHSVNEIFQTMPWSPYSWNTQCSGKSPSAWGYLFWSGPKATVCLLNLFNFQQTTGRCYHRRDSLSVFKKFVICFNWPTLHVESIKPNDREMIWDQNFMILNLEWLVRKSLV